MTPRITCSQLSSSLTGTRSIRTPFSATKPIATTAGGDEAEHGEDQVEHADEQRGAAGGAAGRDQQQAADRDVDEVVPAVDGEDAEHLVGDDLVADGEAGLVEEADDPGDHEDAANQQAVEPGWA